VPVAQRAQRHRVLAAGGVWREGDAWYHRPTGLLRLHVTDRREHTGHIRVCPTYWLVADNNHNIEVVVALVVVIVAVTKQQELYHV